LKSREAGSNPGLAFLLRWDVRVQGKVFRVRLWFTNENLSLAIARTAS
jgi:hypothetical protein